MATMRARCQRCGEAILRTDDGPWFSMGPRVGGLTQPTSQCESSLEGRHVPAEEA
jgi:hypothetical protein